MAAGALGRWVLPLVRHRSASAPEREYGALADANQGRGRILVGADTGGRVPPLPGSSADAYLSRVGINIFEVADVARALAAYQAMPRGRLGRGRPAGRGRGRSQ